MSRQRLTKSPIVNVISDAIFHAAKPLVRDFGEMQHLIHSKRGSDRFVQKAQEIVVRHLTEVLKEKYPAYAIILPPHLQEEQEEKDECEEAPTNSNDEQSQEKVAKEDESENAFFLSPLIGEANFRQAIPQFAFGITVRKKGKIKATAIYDPIKDELFWAERSEGAHLNNKKLYVSSYPKPRGSRLIIETISPDAPAFMDHIHFYAKAQKNCRNILTLGAPILSLAYLAAGRVDGVVCYLSDPGEVESAKLLIEEVGGHFAHHPRENLMLASNNVQVGQFLSSYIK